MLARNFPLRMAIKLLWRDKAAREVWILLFALTISIGLLTSLNFFEKGLRQAAKDQGSQLLGGELIIETEQNIPEQWFKILAKNKLQYTDITQLSSMLGHKTNFKLVGITAVDPDFPLQGELRISTGLQEQSIVTDKTPAPGEIWISPRLFAELDIDLNDLVNLGAIQLKATKVLQQLPGQSGDWFNLVPQALINKTDLTRSKLIQPGSRLKNKIFIIGENLTEKTAELKQQLRPGDQLINLEARLPRYYNNIKVLNHYLSLTAIIGLVMAGVAISLASRCYCQKQYNAVALLSCLGVRAKTIDRIYWFILLICFLFSATIGCILGYLSQDLLYALLKEYLIVKKSVFDFTVIFTGFSLGALLLFGFAFPQFYNLRKVPPKRIMQFSQEPLSFNQNLVYVCALLPLCILIFIETQDYLFTFVLILAGISSVFFFLSGNYLLLRILRKISAPLHFNLRYGIVSLLRNPQRTAIQASAFELIFTLAILLIIVRGDLLISWRNTVPENTPNYYLVNIFPDQVESLQEFFQAKKLETTEYYPLVRGKLVERNGKDIFSTLTEQQKKTRALYRSLNLTWKNQLPASNKLIAGKWHAEQDQQTVSVEKNIAQNLGLKLGEVLGFDIAGERVRAKVTSVREVKWESFKPNFYMIFSQDVLESFPATFMTSFYLSQNKLNILAELFKSFSNTSVIDVDLIIKQFQNFLDQIIDLVSYILVYSLLASIAILWAALQASWEERRKEMLLLHTLGAKHRQLVIFTLSEFTCLGLICGLISTITANVIAIFLNERFFSVPFNFNWTYFVSVPAMSILILNIGGYFGIKRLLGDCR